MAKLYHFLLKPNRPTYSIRYPDCRVNVGQLVQASGCTDKIPAIVTWFKGGESGKDGGIAAAQRTADASGLLREVILSPLHCLGDRRVTLPDDLFLHPHFVYQMAKVFLGKDVASQLASDCRSTKHFDGIRQPD